MTIQREYKDRLFKYIFGHPERKDWSLQLYNILMETDFRDPEKLTLFTLEDVLYRKQKNDLTPSLHGKSRLLSQRN